MGARRTSTKYRDYYFLPQFEAGQHELVELHHYTYEVDLHAMMPRGHDKGLSERVRGVNAVLLEHCLFSTQRQADYDKMMSVDQFKASKRSNLNPNPNPNPNPNLNPNPNPNPNPDPDPNPDPNSTSGSTRASRGSGCTGRAWSAQSSCTLS